MLFEMSIDGPLLNAFVKAFLFELSANFILGEGFQLRFASMQ
jgi:hypothetical protein